MPRLLWLFCLVTVTLAGCASADTPQPASSSNATPLPAASAVILGDGRAPDLPAINAERERRRAALQAPPHIVLRPNLDAASDAAQRAAAADERVQAAVRSLDGQRWLAEVMAVGAARAGDLAGALATTCGRAACRRVVIYVYPTKTTITAIVDQQGQTLDVQSLAAAQPEIPRELTDLATTIAVAAWTAQGPDAFVEPPEPLSGSAVIWYAPRLINAERERYWADMELEDGVLTPHIWPCAGGLKRAS